MNQPLQKEAFPPSWVDAQARRKIDSLFLKPVFDGDYFGLRFRYNPTLQKALKERLGANFFVHEGSSYTKSWMVQDDVIRNESSALQAVLDEVKLGVSSRDFIAWLDSGPRDRAAFVVRTKVKVYGLGDGGYLLNSMPYHLRTRGYLKGAGGTYLKSIRSWLFSETTSLTLLLDEMCDYCAIDRSQIEIIPGTYRLDMPGGAKGDGPPIPLGDCTRKVNEDSPKWGTEEESEALHLVPEIAAYEGSIQSEDDVRGVIEALPLFDYQKKNAIFMATRPGAANFSEQGTGKTMTTIAALHAIAPNEPKLIACPVNLQLNWEDDIRKLFPDATISTVAPSRDVEWVILGTTQLDKVEDWRGHFKAMAVDEAHLMKELSSFRTQHLLLLAEHIPRCFVLTGTPIPNREQELYTLLRITRHPIGLLPLEEFRERYCGNVQARAMLSAAIKMWFVRSMKIDVLKLPPKHRNTILITPSKKFLDAYNEIIEDSAMNSLTKIHKLLRMGEEFKAAWAVKHIKGLPKDEKTVVFTAYNDTVETVSDQLDRAKIPAIKALVEGATEKKRHGYATAFRDDESKRAYIGTISGNSTGLNLQRGNHSYVLTLPWTAAALAQAEDRTHRIGQIRAVNIYIPLLQGTIDQDLFELVAYKAELSKSVIGGAEADDDEEVERENKARIAMILTKGRRSGSKA